MMPSMNIALSLKELKEVPKFPKATRAFYHSRVAVLAGAGQEWWTKRSHLKRAAVVSVSDTQCLSLLAE